MPERVVMDRKTNWRDEHPGVVVVAYPSRWANPFPVDQWGLELSLALYGDMVNGMWSPSTFGQHHTDEEFSAVYAQHTAWRKRNGGHPRENARYELAGHDLACRCPLNVECHADVLLKLLERRG